MDSNELLEIVEYCTNDPSFLYELEEHEISTLLDNCRVLFQADDTSHEAKERILTFYFILIQTEILDLQSRWTIWMEMRITLFKLPQFISLDTYLRSSYRAIFLSLQKEITPYIDLNPLPGKTNRVVVITNQFLGSLHAPTRSVLEFSTAIQESLGYPVTIINDGSHNLNTFGYALPPTHINFEADYNNTNRIVWGTTTFDFYQNPAPAMNIQGIINMLQTIRRLQPCLVLYFGSGSLLADLCMLMTQTACLEFAFDFPVTLTRNILVPRPVTPEDNIILQHKEAYQKVVETAYTYVPDNYTPDPTLTKASLGISGNSKICLIVGNRLDSDITPDLLKLLDRICQDNNDAYFVLIGQCGNFENFKSLMHNPEHLISLGYRDDYLNILELCHLYIQPRRLGGGRSVFEALYAGVPVVSLPFGDGQYVCGTDFLVDDLPAMELQIRKYLSDDSFHAKMCEKAHKRASALTNMEDTFRDLFSKLLPSK